MKENGREREIKTNDNIVPPNFQRFIYIAGCESKTISKYKNEFKK